MKCPVCDKWLVFPDVVYINMESYLEPCLVKTQCCGYGVRLVPRMEFNAYTYMGKHTQDDWGETFKRRVKD